MLSARNSLFHPLGSLPAEGVLGIPFFIPSAPFPPKARGRWGFDASGKIRRSIVDAQHLGFVFFVRVQLVEALDEKEEGQLFDDGQRVGHTTRPKGVPYLVNLGSDGAIQHLVLLLKVECWHAIG